MYTYPVSLRVFVFLELFDHVQHLWSRRGRRWRRRCNDIVRRIIGGFVAIGSRNRAAADEVV